MSDVLKTIFVVIVTAGVVYLTGITEFVTTTLTGAFPA